MLPIRTILYPTDFSTQSEYAFQVACALARDYSARLIALHVVEQTFIYGDLSMPYIPPQGQLETAKEQLARLEVPDLRIEVEHRLCEGIPAEEILRAADETQSDLIVMGTHGRTGLGRMLMGSVAEEVLRKARCPVLTLKAPLSHPAPASSAQSSRSVTVV